MSSPRTRFFSDGPVVYLAHYFGPNPTNSIYHGDRFLYLSTYVDDMWFNLYFINKDALFYFLENDLNLKEGRHFSHLGSQDACQSLQSIITTTFHWAYSHQTKVYQAPLQRDEVVFHTIKRKMCKESRPHKKERETERQRETEKKYNVYVKRKRRKTTNFKNKTQHFCNHI